MATRGKNGWAWTSEEREWVKTWQRDVYRQQREISEQLSRFEDMLPNMAAQASLAARPFMVACRPLLAIDARRGGRKHQPVSPEEAKEKLEDAGKGLVEWEAFLDRPEVSEAIEEANADIRTTRLKAREAKRQALERIEQSEFTAAVEAKALDVVNLANYYAQSAQFATGYGTARDLPTLERLFLIQFIRLSFEGDSTKTADMKRFVSSEPKPPLADVVAHALYLLTKGAVQRWPNVDDADMNPIGKNISLAQQRLHESIARLMEQGVAPEFTSRREFSICRKDYSTETKPKGS